MSATITYAQLCAVERKAERHFMAAANALEKTSDREYQAQFPRLEKRAESQRAKAEALLAPFGITCDYPGLYPSFKVGGYGHHCVRSALSDAVGYMKVQP